MSGFLDHLVGLALGKTDESAVRLLLPPRFADSGVNEVQETIGAKHWAISNAPANNVLMEMRSKVEFEEAKQPVSKPAGPTSTTAPTAPSDQPHVRPAIDADTSSLQSRTAAAGDNRTTQPPPPLTKQLFVQRTPTPIETNYSSFAQVPIIKSVSRPNTPPVIPRLQPLSQAAVASIRQTSHSLPPVIEVVIDRIDIRAPAVERPASQAKRKPREPSVALGDYLRGERRLS